MRCAPLDADTRLFRIETAEADWAAQSPEALLWMLQQMLLIRRFEEKVLDLSDRGLVNGPVHTSIGQEAVAVGAAAAVRVSDRFAGTHRAHHQYLAKALNACAVPKYNPLDDGLTPEMHDHVRILLREIMGLAKGCSGGRGGSMHLFNETIGVAGTNAIVGGGTPIATGMAWADAFQGNDRTTFCFFGDGALYQGAVHEACNLASIWQAPIVYVIENNLYAVATRSGYACSADPLCATARAYGMPGFLVDGMDPVSVRLAIEHLLKHRDEYLPCSLEVQTYRHLHHAGPHRGSAYGYREKQEEAEWHKRDPIQNCEAMLQRLGILDPAGSEVLQSHAAECIEKAADSCLKTSVNGTIVIREELWPQPDALMHGLRDEDLAAPGPFVEAEDLACDREIRCSDAVAEVTGRWLEKEPLAFILGEEVANLGGGGHGATKGLPELYPDRVRNTPITEAGFCGLACGAAMNGMRPIIEIMFPSFGLVAADQLFNQIAQLAHIYGGNVAIPLVARTRIAIGLGYGAQHSLDPVALFSLFPGWRIFVPTTPFDYVGLFNAAMKLQSPVLMVEHHELYGRQGMLPQGPPDHIVQPGRAKILRTGGDVTVVAYGYAATLALEAASESEAEGVDAEVIDLRTVDDAGLDYETIGRSLRKTGMLVTVEQAPSCNSIGAKIISQCQARFFDFLDGPPVSINAPDVPLPVSRRLELLCMPTKEQIAATIRCAAQRQI